MNTPFFTIDCLRAGYGEHKVLTDFSCQLEPGTLTALLGANGSGKTTLLRSVCGLLPHEGSCTLEGQPLEALSPRQLARKVSYIPQSSGVTLSLPVLDVVLMGFNPVLGLLERPNARQREQAKQALASVGLSGLEGRDYLTLSQGQKQLVILARTVVENTDLLVLDEPDSALDFANRHRMLSLLSRMVKAGNKAGLLCLHDPNLALQFCEQLLLLKEGRCMAVLHPRTDPIPVMEEALSQLYGPVSLARHSKRDGTQTLTMLCETGGDEPCVL